METKIYNINTAMRRVLKNLEKRGFQIENILSINNGRYIIARSLNRKNIMIIYKREPFFNFGFMFEKEGETGVGDTINVKDLKEAIINGVGYIYTVFPNGYVYKITLDEFLDKSHRWVNKEGKDVRSISIHNYKREFKLFEGDC